MAYRGIGTNPENEAFCRIYPPPAAFIEKLESELGFEFMQLYGLTETAPLLTISRPDHATQSDDWPRRARAGVPGLGVELEVRDEDDNPHRSSTL